MKKIFHTLSFILNISTSLCHLSCRRCRRHLFYLRLCRRPCLNLQAFGYSDCCTENFVAVGFEPVASPP